VAPPGRFFAGKKKWKTSHRPIVNFQKSETRISAGMARITLQVTVLSKGMRRGVTTFWLLGAGASVG
jgi:hypothetical protein